MSLWAGDAIKEDGYKMEYSGALKNKTELEGARIQSLKWVIAVEHNSMTVIDGRPTRMQFRKYKNYVQDTSTLGGGLACLANCSKNRNAANMKIVWEHHNLGGLLESKAYLVPTRDIRAGEELTWYYQWSAKKEQQHRCRGAARYARS